MTNFQKENALRKKEIKRKIVVSCLLMAFIGIIFFANGCASRDYFLEANNCQALANEAVENQKGCQSAIGEVDCEAVFPIPSCEVEWKAWNDHEDWLAKREEKERAEKAFRESCGRAVPVCEVFMGKRFRCQCVSRGSIGDLFDL